MLHVRVIAPRDACDSALATIEADPATTEPVVIRGVALGGQGDLVLFDVAREKANDVIDTLRRLHIDRTGSITLEEPLTVLSAAARKAEAAAPGNPADGVVWDEIEARAEDDARPAWTFLAFLVLAVLIAGVGRYLDQTVLIIGAMVVGPEFSAVAAICVGLVRARHRVILPATINLLGGLAFAAAVSWAVWGTAHLLGLLDVGRATSGEQTAFVLSVSVWSFLIALLAGCAGMLSLTTDKSSALVGVFISVTTVPAVGALGLTMAVGAWSEAGDALAQLGLNLAGLVVAGTATLVVQSTLWRRPRPSDEREPAV